MNNPKVSVCMITYNHENYIREAIEGVLMQFCDFEIELIIANDCSTDKTDEVIQDMIQQHPNASWINYTNHIENKGMMLNFIWALEQCEGEFIALCEGDDYWTDSLKLQKQVDFLELNKQAIFCYHKANQIIDGKIDYNSYYPKDVHKSILNEVEFFQSLATPTASVVFRNIIEIPKLLHSNGDFLLYCTLLSKGNAGFINEEMSIYRVHDTGISFEYNKSRYLERRIRELRVEKKYPYFSKKVRNQIDRIIFKYISYYILKNKDNMRLSQKMSYFKILLGLKSFYNQPLKKNIALINSFFK